MNGEIIDRRGLENGLANKLSHDVLPSCTSRSSEWKPSVLRPLSVWENQYFAQNRGLFSSSLWLLHKFRKQKSKYYESWMKYSLKIMSSTVNREVFIIYGLNRALGIHYVDHHWENFENIFRSWKENSNCVISSVVATCKFDVSHRPEQSNIKWMITNGLFLEGFTQVGSL